MDCIEEKIMERLHQTQKDYHVRIPIAVESGSRAWGFASPDSDYDCRFIYVHEMDWYLSIFDKKDVIEYAVDEIFDISGWDIKKALKHMVQSNAVMMEWLTSGKIYISDTDMTKKLRALALEFFNPVAASWHYLSIAKKKYQEVLLDETPKLKTYFYILRPLAAVAYICRYKKPPYMEYDRTLAELDISDNILVQIEKLKKLKASANESFRVERPMLLDAYVQIEIERFENQIKQMKFDKNRNYEKADQTFREIIEWANGQW